MKIANRKAKAAREADLNALQAYANLGVTPEDWKRFRVQYREFFPENLTDWFYDFAEEWYRKFQAYPKVREVVRPPLLFYRDCLRRVWTRDDHAGINLKLLLGFEQELKDMHRLNAPSMEAWIGKKRGKSIMNVYIPGQPLDIDQQTTLAGLPPGRPIVDGVSGEITWEFGCAVQQSVYELMQQRWRAIVCPECGKFVLADKTNQTYCSLACSGEVKRKRALDYWNRKGSAERDKRRVTEKRRS
jgi:hypothetical protein